MTAWLVDPALRVRQNRDVGGVGEPSPDRVRNPRANHERPVCSRVSQALNAEANRRTSGIFVSARRRRRARGERFTRHERSSRHSEVARCYRKPTRDDVDERAADRYASGQTLCNARAALDVWTTATLEGRSEYPDHRPREITQGQGIRSQVGFVEWRSLCVLCWLVQMPREGAVCITCGRYRGGLAAGQVSGWR